MAKSAGLDEAQALAIALLGFLAADEERMGRFLALTGVDPSDIRALMRDRGFWIAIFDHMFEDESLLLSFCGQEGMAPEQLVRVRHSLASPHDRGLREA